MKGGRMTGAEEGGAGSRNRTDDILLGKQTLYQLSYARIRKLRHGVGASLQHVARSVPGKQFRSGAPELA